MSKNSLGPWAFDSGPRTPVTMNWAFGQSPLKYPIKGIEPPSAIVRYYSLKKALLAPLIAFSIIGGNIALSKPSPPLVLT